MRGQKCWFHTVLVPFCAFLKFCFLSNRKHGVFVSWMPKEEMTLNGQSATKQIIYYIMSLIFILHSACFLMPAVLSTAKHIITVVHTGALLHPLAAGHSGQRR